MACMLRSLQCRNKVVYGKRALQHNVAAANHLLLRKKHVWLPEVGMAKLNPGDLRKLFPLNFIKMLFHEDCAPHEFGTIQYVFLFSFLGMW